MIKIDFAVGLKQSNFEYPKLLFVLVQKMEIPNFLLFLL